MSKKNIVTIGAGYAGVHAAKRLAKRYKKDDSVSITLIDRDSYHTMMTELHEVAAARVEPDAIQFDLRRLFNRTKVNLVTDNVTHVDYDDQCITTEHGSFPFDYLILGMGAEPNDFNIPGVKENGFTLWSWEDAVKLREHIERTVQKAARTHDKKLRRAMLTFVVCGAGFTGVEMVGELFEWKTRLAKDYKIDADDITLYLVEAAPTILNMLNRKDADRAEAYLMKNDVSILKNTPLVDVRPDSIILKSGESLPTHTLIWTAGVQGNSDVDAYHMAEGRAGRLKVNEYMEADGLEKVYVVGDLAYFEEAPEQPTPQIVQAAEQTADTAVTSIVSEISGDKKKAYKGKYDGFMVSIGSRYGVANVMGVSLHGWFSNFVKHMINLVYLFGLGSGYYMMAYIKHEFFDIKDKRNIFRDLPARFGNVLWSVPLRIFLACFWLFAAFGKAWGTETLFHTSTSSLFIFLAFIIGFALLFGLFTWFASFTSFILLIIFSLMGMISLSQAWTIPAAFALMNGSGRTIGLDYWVIPYLQTNVGNWWYGKECAIYKDKK